jgi:hypothetical protein
LEREAQYLHPANERLLLEAERLQGQNEILKRLIAHNQRVTDRLKAALAEAKAEQKAILTELRAALPEAKSLYAPLSLSPFANVYRRTGKPVASGSFEAEWDAIVTALLEQSA